jgi:hypothetical protein
MTYSLPTRLLLALTFAPLAVNAYAQFGAEFERQADIPSVVAQVREQLEASRRQRRKNRWPCAIDDTTTITLMPENNHYDPAVIERRQNFHQLGRQRKAYVAIEGHCTERDISGNHLFCIDDQRAEGLVALIQIADYARFFQPKEQIASGLLIMLRENRHVRQAWEDMKAAEDLDPFRKFKDTDDFIKNANEFNADLRGVVRIIDEFLIHQDRSIEDGVSSLKNLDEVATWSRIVALAIAYSRRLANEDPSSPPEIQSVKDILQMPHEHDRERQFLIVDWRNSLMIQNIAAVYCQAQRDAQQVFIPIGAGHVPGLEALLFQEGVPERSVVIER